MKLNKKVILSLPWISTATIISVFLISVNPESVDNKAVNIFSQICVLWLRGAVVGGRERAIDFSVYMMEEFYEIYKNIKMKKKLKEMIKHKKIWERINE